MPADVLSPPPPPLGVATQSRRRVGLNDTQVDYLRRKVHKGVVTHYRMRIDVLLNGERQTSPFDIAEDDQVDVDFDLECLGSGQLDEVDALAAYAYKNMP